MKIIDFDKCGMNKPKLRELHTKCVILNNNNNGITQAAFPQSGSSSTWGTNGFTSLSKDGVAKEDHLNIQPHGQARN